MQPSLFGVEATDPTPDDLSGLLAGPGELGRMGGTARVSVPVTEGWRVHVLIAELALRKLPASWLERVGEVGGQFVASERSSAASERSSAASDAVGLTASDAAGFVVHTAYTTRLMGLAVAWQDGPPPGLHLNGQMLRLWVAAAGAASPDGYLLGLHPARQRDWEPLGAALAAAGLAAALVVSEPAYRITGRKRLVRLTELVGDRPATAPSTCWPHIPGRS